MSKLHVKSRRRFRTIQPASAVNLPFPVHPQMRLAVLSESAPAFGVLPAYRPESALDLQGFSPNMLAGTCADLQTLAEQVDLGTVDLSCLDHAVIALTRCGDEPLNDVARVVFWQVFGVPVFELFTGLDDAVLGYECELHEGWHLAPDVELSSVNGELFLEAPGVHGLRTALSGFVTNDKCPCGREGPRLMEMQPIQHKEPNQRWAAIA